MKNYFLYILTAALAISLSANIGLFLKNRQLQNKDEKMIKLLAKTNDLFDTFSETINTFIKTSGTSVAGMELRDSRGNQKMLNEIIEDEKMLVYLPKISCNACTSRETELVKTIFGEDVKDVMIVSNFQSIREQIIFEREAQIATYSFKQGESFPVQEFEQHTVIFLVTKNLQAHCILLPNDKMDKISEIYYRAVAKKFRTT